MCGTACNPSPNNWVCVWNLQSTFLQSASCKSPPLKLMVPGLYQQIAWLIYTSNFYGFQGIHEFVLMFPFMLGLEIWGGRDRRDTTFVSRVHQSHLLQAHMWGCVLLLQQFAIYQLNRQMLNDFLHLLDWWCCAILDRRPMQHTPPFLHETPPNTPSPSLFWFLQQVRRQQFKIFLDKLL